MPDPTNEGSPKSTIVAADKDLSVTKTLENTTNNSRQQQWDETATRVDKAVDGLGLEIDKGIKDAVVGLNVHGINTFQSCEGHLDGRDSMSPYIDIKADGAEDFETQIDNSEGSEKDKLMEKLYKLNLEERKKLLALLGEFYQEKNDTPFDQRLIVVGGGNGWARLENQGADIQTILSAEDRARQLEAYQLEMKTFTGFLKDKFFSDDVSAELASLYEADQVDRINYREPEVSVRDKQRLERVKSLISKGLVSSPEGMFHAAMILQHGEVSEDFEQANGLAKQSMDQGYEPSKWLYAATYDRWQRSRDLPQKFGTQFDHEGKIQPYDQATTDEERAKYNVPPLKELVKRATNKNSIVEPAVDLE